MASRLRRRPVAAAIVLLLASLAAATPADGNWTGVLTGVAAGPHTYCATALDDNGYNNLSRSLGCKPVNVT